MRAIVTRPACTSVRSREMKLCHALGTITMSMPALTAVRTSAAVKPGAPSIWSMPFQSETTKPEKPSSPLSTVVIRYWWPCIFTPFHELYEIMTEPTPRCTAAWNGGRWMARSCGLGELRVALVDAARRAAVADVVLRGGQHGPGRAQRLVPCRPLIIVVIDEASSGVSPNDS